MRLDKEGFLVDLSDWNNATALELANRAGIRLSDEHWAVIAVLRDFHQTTGVSPAMRPFVKLVGERWAPQRGPASTFCHFFREVLRSWQRRSRGCLGPPTAFDRSMSAEATSQCDDSPDDHNRWAVHVGAGYSSSKRVQRRLDDLLIRKGAAGDQGSRHSRVHAV